MVLRGAWCFVLLVFPLVSLIVDTQPSRIGNNDLLILNILSSCTPTSVEAYTYIPIQKATHNYHPTKHECKHHAQQLKPAQPGQRSLAVPIYSRRGGVSDLRSLNRVICQ
jgi:hypothetical protein